MKGKILRLAIVLLGLPFVIWGCFALAANPYNIVYEGGSVLGATNVTENASLANSLAPLVKAYNNIEVSVSGAKWRNGAYLKYEDDRGAKCMPFRYVLVTKDSNISSSDNLSFTLTDRANGFSVEAKITQTVFDGSSDKTYVVGVTDGDGELYAGYGFIYTDNTCTTELSGINGLGPWNNDKVFVQLNTKLHKIGQTAVFKSNEQYYGITDIDSAQSYKVLNSDNGLTKERMLVKNASDLQPMNNSLRNMFVSSNNGNYIYSQFAWDGTNVHVVASPEEANIYLKLTDDGTAQNNGLDMVYGFAYGAGSGIEYYTKKYTVNYVSDNNGSVTGISTEKVFSGDNPAGSTSSPNPGYHFANCWKADVSVTVQGASIPAGTCLTPEQVKQVEVDQDITFTAIHEPNGKIKVVKNNSETGECIASFNTDVTFTLTKNGQTIRPATRLTNCELTWQDLTEYGTYQIIETYSGSSYNPGSPKTVVLSSTNYEQTVTFGNEPKKGELTINKVDSKTKTCTAQGNATISGTEFKVTNISGYQISYNGNIINNNGVVATKTLQASDNCAFKLTNLPYGKYRIEETKAGSGYQIVTATKEVNIPSDSNASVSVIFENAAITGKITINKIDAETKQCSVTSKYHSFEGITFKITNESTNPVWYNNQLVAVHGEITTKTLANNECSFEISNLPYGNYKIKETATSKGYALNTTEYTLSVPNNTSVTIPNQPIRGDLKFVKKDANNDTLMQNTLFSISAMDDNYNIIETHLVITDQNGVIDTRSSHNLHSNQTNGYDPLYDESDALSYAGYGTWFGFDSANKALPVVDSLGALPYGKYLVQELKCPANHFCYEIKDQKKIISITENNQLIDLGDWDNNCAVFSIETEAMDPVDNDKYVEATKKATIKDHISYCARRDRTFTLKGTLIDKSTGEPLQIDGKPVESSIEVTPKEDCEEVDMEFVFDATGLGGKELVVYEQILYNDEVIYAHEDLDDAGQTVEMVYLKTTATNLADGGKTLPLDEDVTINEKIEYCLKSGFEYTVISTLKDKKTGQDIMMDGKALTKTTTFTPEKTCGSIDVSFTLNTADMAGYELVIFDSLYRGKELILEHKDVNNADETVNVEIPAPNTGAPASETTFSSIATPVFGTILGALFVVLPSRLHRKKVGFSKKS